VKITIFVTPLASFSVIAGCAALHALRRAICCGAIRPISARAHLSGDGPTRMEGA
jgi:hypothetical protein